MSYSLLVGHVSPGRAEASPWDVSPSHSTIPPLSSFLPSPCPAHPLQGNPSMSIHAAWSFRSSGQPTGAVESKLRWGCGVHPQMLCFSLMDQTAAGGSLQPALSWGGMWHVPSQGHAWHVAFPRRAPRYGRAALLTVKTKKRPSWVGGFLSPCCTS